MIPVAPAPKPATFDAKVRRPGQLAIAELCGKSPKVKRIAGRSFKKVPGAKREGDIPFDRFPAYWTRCLDELMSAYREICAYSCFRIHPVTGARSADHFVAKSMTWRRVYEWSNYRLCSSRMNARKNDAGTVLDPFAIQPDSFQLELLGFQVHPDRSLPVAKQLPIQQTIDRLGLNEFRHDRARDAERYWLRASDPKEGIALRVLQEESPFVAYELYRQDRLNPGDIW